MALALSSGCLASSLMLGLGGKRELRITLALIIMSHTCTKYRRNGYIDEKEENLETLLHPRSDGFEMGVHLAWNVSTGQKNIE